MLRDVGSVVVTDNRKTSVSDQVHLVLATAERSVKEPEDLNLIRSDAEQALSRVEISDRRLQSPQERGRPDGSITRGTASESRSGPA
jgi:hypothetical protein